MAVHSDLMMEIAIPVCAVVGIAFSLVQLRRGSRSPWCSCPAGWALHRRLCLSAQHNEEVVEEVVEEEDPTPHNEEVSEEGDSPQHNEEVNEKVIEEGDPTQHNEELIEEGDPTQHNEEVIEEGDPTQHNEEVIEEVIEEGDPTQHNEEVIEEVIEEGDPTQNNEVVREIVLKVKEDPTHLRAVRRQYAEIKDTISEGVKSFMLKEYQYAGVFVVAFAIVIFLLLGSVERFSTQSRPCTSNHSKTCKSALVTAVFSAVSFLLGAFTSVLFGSLGMKIAIYADTRTALEKSNITGVAGGFLLAAIDLLVLYLAINLFKLYYGNDWEGLFEAITGYALGGSSMALFGRASGGIYAKAADVCLHLVEQIEPTSLLTYRNPIVVCNYVGDIVGDIAGMGPDLLSSYAESSCAALVLASTSSFGIEQNFTAICYPLLISSMGILVCLITTVWWEIKPASKEKQLFKSKKEQLFISTILMTFGILLVSFIALPKSFTIYNIGLPKVVKNWKLFLCVGVGLWAGLISGLVNKNYTNDDFSSPQHVNDAAHNFCNPLKGVCARIFGKGPQAVLETVSVALGSATIPFFAAASIFFGYNFAATYGIALAALGMLSTIATRLAIDTSGVISDNAKRIAQVAGGADNTTADTGKEFAIESAALVTIAVLGAFVNRPAMSSSVDVLTPEVIVGVIMGTWLPYRFSAMTMKSVGCAAVEMTMEDLKQLGSSPVMIGVYESADYATCFKIATVASFRGMIGPVALVMFTPLIIGTFFGVEMLSGLLAGSLSSVVQIAISASNTDGAWIQAKEDIKAGALECAEKYQQERPGLFNIAKSGKTIGDPRKDTSGPPLNILIQLMAVESLVFAPFFATHGGLLYKFLHHLSLI